MYQFFSSLEIPSCLMYGPFDAQSIHSPGSGFYKCECHLHQLAHNPLHQFPLIQIATY